MDKHAVAAEAIWKMYERSFNKTNQDKDAFLLNVSECLKQIYDTTPVWLSQALNEGDGVYRP